jgi:hypothetical protein
VEENGATVKLGSDWFFRNLKSDAMWFSLPFEVIWKHHMGERRWTAFDLISHTIAIYGAVFLMTVFFFPDMAVPLTGHDQHLMERQMQALNGFVLLMWILGLANLWEIRKRRKAGIEWHTYYRGKPRFLPDTFFFQFFVIPLGSGLIAYGFFRLAHPLGIYLFGMAFFQFVNPPGHLFKHEAESLDRRDREMELENKIARMENDRRGSWDVVRVAKPESRMRRAEETEQFETRWKTVLKSSDAQNLED